MTFKNANFHQTLQKIFNWSNSARIFSHTIWSDSKIGMGVFYTSDHVTGGLANFNSLSGQDQEVKMAKFFFFDSLLTSWTTNESNQHQNWHRGSRTYYICISTSKISKWCSNSFQKGLFLKKWLFFVGFYFSLSLYMLWTPYFSCSSLQTLKENVFLLFRC